MKSTEITTDEAQQSAVLDFIERGRRAQEAVDRILTAEAERQQAARRRSDPVGCLR